MSRMLVNGCSYMTKWGVKASELGSKLGYDETVNLSLIGGSNDRCFRTTVDYILDNPVDFVIIGLTFWSRRESPWATECPIEGPWVSYGGLNLNHSQIGGMGRQLTVHQSDVDEFLKARVRVDWHQPHSERLITDLICFTGWLRSRKIGYCIFGTCDKNYDSPALPEPKRRAVMSDPGIIDIFNWSSNQYLYQHGVKSDDVVKVDSPLLAHYATAGHDCLNDFLYNYIHDHDLQIL